MEEKTEEVKKDEGKETKSPVENPDKGDKPQVYKPIDDTNLAAKRLEDATKEAREERLKAEESYAKMKLGGSSEAGSVSEKKEETPEEYAHRIYPSGFETKPAVK